MGLRPIPRALRAVSFLDRALPLRGLALQWGPPPPARRRFSMGRRPTQRYWSVMEPVEPANSFDVTFSDFRPAPAVPYAVPVSVKGFVILSSSAWRMTSSADQLEGT